jgi:hypothetical protein
MNGRRLDLLDTVGNLNVDVANAKGAWNALREAYNEGTLQEAVGTAANTFDYLLNKPEDMRHGKYDPIEFPVFVAVQDYHTAVEDYKAAIEDYNTAANLVNEHARTRQAEASNIDQNQELTATQALLLEKANRVRDRELATANRVRDKANRVRDKAVRVVDMANIVRAAAKAVFFILDSSAKLNNGSEHTRQSTPRRVSSNPASRTAPQKTSAMTTETFHFPLEVQQKQLPDLFKRFCTCIDELMASSEAANELDNLNITATVEAILSLSENSISLDIANRARPDRQRVRKFGKENTVVQPVLAAILWKMMQLVGSAADLK